MADQLVPAASATSNPADNEPPKTFALLVVSPSPGVASPLKLEQLPLDTTVKQVKAKIRDAVSSRPDDAAQRLIHRGRMLGRDEETMLEVFGMQTFQATEPQILHLVLRPDNMGGNPGNPPRAGTPIPQTTMQPPNMFQRPMIPPNGGRSVYQQSTLSQPHLPLTPLNLPPPPPPPPLLALQQRALQLSNIEQASHVLAQRAMNLQRETQILQQQMALLERDRQGLTNAALIDGSIPPPSQTRQIGPQHAPGLSQQNGSLPGPPPTSLQSENPAHHNNFHQHLRDMLAQQSRVHSAPDQQTAAQIGQSNASAPQPDHTAIFTQQGVGPNGQRWHVSINQTTTTMPVPQAAQQQVPHMNQLPPAQFPDVQALLRRIDRQGLRHRQDSMQRSASNPPPSTRDGAVLNQIPNTRPGTPGAAINPIFAALNASTGPNPTMPAFASNALLAAAAGVNASPPTEPTVYILSSPQGPRGLLVNNAETFYTPRTSTRTSSRRHDATPSGRSTARDNTQNAERRGHRQHRHRHQRREGVVVEPVAPAAHPANPRAGVVVAQIWPTIWLIVRLGIFVWFFTAGHNSWSRTVIVTTAAFVIFIINTGIFDGAAEQVWGPVRRHLEALLPLAGPDAPADGAIAQAQEDGGVNIVGGQREVRRDGELDSAEVAQRLSEQRRRQSGWIMTQVRRAEHSMLLFLASLVPGVGERHIAARERETAAAAAEAQRQRETVAAPQGTSEEPGAQQMDAEQPAHEGNAGDEVVDHGANEPGLGERPAAPMMPLIEA